MDSIFSLIFGLVGKWYIWLPVVAVLTYLAFRNRKRAETVTLNIEIEHSLLVLEIPRTNDKQGVAAEQMFASLHGILKSKRELLAQGGLQEHISFEIVAKRSQIRFYVWVPKFLQNFVEGQIYAQYPTVQIYVADEDYTTVPHDQPVQHTTEMGLINNDVLPVKTFQSFEADPLAAITATLAKLEEPNEEVWIQILARPVDDDWQKRSSSYISTLKNGKPAALFFGGNNKHYFKQIFTALWKPPVHKEVKPGAELSERDKVRISEVEKKSNKLGYEVKIRLAYLGNSQNTARLRIQSLIGTFKQFNLTNLNGFQEENPTFDPEGIAQYRARFFIDHGYVLNIEELASVFHLPHTNVETPNIVWASAKTAEPPTNLPVVIDTSSDKDVSIFGLTNFRGQHRQFGLFRTDRSRHMYIIGQTGTGKSGLLELLALSDTFHNQGYAIIDPHGECATNNMRFIPESRIKDVVYFNPADTAFPVAFNPMEVTDPSMKNTTSSEIIGAMKRMFGESWGPRLEYILRYTILALLDFPGTTMLDIQRMLTEKNFRKEVLSHVKDSVVLNFWNVEFASWNDKFASEAISPVLNKVGAFTANPIIRNIIGQPKSSFNVRKIMDEGKILIVNLSKGLIGEDNAALLGAFLVIKIQLAALSRSDIIPDERRPFYLYVDEFQNFATDSFAVILSEARKYGLCLTVANQYVSQMQETVRDAVFGNVGTMVTFRVSGDDADVLAKPFAPQFTPDDLLQMHNRHFIISMIIKGEKSQAFSATTLTLPKTARDFSAEIIANSRQLYARPRTEVEAITTRLAEVAPATLPQPPKNNNNGGNWQKPPMMQQRPQQPPQMQSNGNQQPPRFNNSYNNGQGQNQPSSQGPRPMGQQPYSGGQPPRQSSNQYNNRFVNNTNTGNNGVNKPKFIPQQPQKPFQPQAPQQPVQRRDFQPNPSQPAPAIQNKPAQTQPQIPRDDFHADVKLH
ncbi:MAG TPA: type IV secretion system DNA-binding domain-containing protein [Candidatus Acidoferrum sp.]|nr:type IV secretion system DNA-binding domain-containing protein [Candidatus Acidoferrum sp.]